MEVTTALLVAIMFITIVTAGIVNIITAITTIFEQIGKKPLDWVLISWIILLLLIHLNLFWETIIILEEEEWSFAEFLFVLLGPMLLFLTSGLILTYSADGIPTFSRAHYVEVERRFFSGLCLLMIWALGAEFIFGKGAISNAAGDLASLILFGILAASRNERIHAALTVVAWILILTLFVLQARGAIA